MNNTMQINYWTVGGFEGEKPIAQALAEAKEMGFQGMELTFGAGVFNDDISEDECKDIAQEADKLDMKIESLATGFYWGCSLSSTDESVRQQALEFTRKYIQVANWLGVDTILVVPGAVAAPWDPDVPVTPYADVWDTATRSLEELLPLVEEKKVTLAIENVWNWFLLGPYEMRTFIDQFNSPFVASYFDVGNCLINGYPEHWIEVLGHRVARVHVKNFERTDCGGTLHGFTDDLMKGDVDWPAVVAALKNIGYRNAITAEMIPFCRLPDLVLPDLDLARDSATKLSRILA